MEISIQSIRILEDFINLPPPHKNPNLWLSQSARNMLSIICRVWLSCNKKNDKRLLHEDFLKTTMNDDAELISKQVKIVKSWQFAPGN